jgi:hypothetical protein
MPQWHTRTELRIQERQQRKGRKTGPTSGKEKDAPWGYQAELTSGDREIASRVFHPTTGTGGRVTVEVSATAEAEEVVP